MELGCDPLLGSDQKQKKLKMDITCPPQVTNRSLDSETAFNFTGRYHHILISLALMAQDLNN